MLRIAATGLAFAIDILGNARGRLRRANARIATWGGAEMVKVAKAQFRSASDTTPTATAVRTGTLRSAYTHRVLTEGANWAGPIYLQVGLVSSGLSKEVLRYAPVQEYGKTIRAKGGGFLAIPTEFGKTAAGVGRGWPRDIIPKGTPGVYTGKWDGKGGVLFGPMYQGGLASFPLFLLRKEVYVPPRPALEPARVAVQPKMEEAMANAAVAILGK